VAEVESAMQTPDGHWRVEIVRDRGTRWYRVVHGDNVLDWLTIAAVQRILDEADIEMTDLHDVSDQPAGPTGGAKPGAA
jgi:bifunctional non-homologous end joining protein LigD